MATSKLIADRPVPMEVDGSIVWRSNYKITPPVNTSSGAVADGTVDLPFDSNKTESEISADMQTAIAEHANLQTSLEGVNAFTISDVVGGGL